MGSSKSADPADLQDRPGPALGPGLATNGISYPMQSMPPLEERIGRSHQ
jgi:hypothetical protein